MDSLLVLLSLSFSAAAILLTAYIAYRLKQRNKLDLSGFNSLLEASTAHIMGLLRRLESRVGENQSRLEALTAEASGFKSEIRQRAEEIRSINESLKPLMAVHIKLSQGFRELHSKVSSLEARLARLEEAVRARRREAALRVSPRPQPLKITSEREVSFANLTPTEMEVLRLLYMSGPKTASEIREVIGRTREHTARLMKKLYLEGYVERDSNTIPYTYRLSDKIRRSFEFSVRRSEG